MLRFSLVVVASLCTLSAAPPQRPATPARNSGASMNVLPRDVNSCASWTEARKGVDDPANVKAKVIEGASRAWIWGLMTGASVYGRRPLADVPVGAAEAWMDKYCADHPLDRLDQAGLQLIEELAARAKSDQ